MKNSAFRFFQIICIVFLFSCTKKTIPVSAASGKEEAPKPVNKKSASVPKINTPVPKMIVVNDAVAKRTVEGRYFYDLNGKRYYRNNKDGKYYLYNKSIFSNPDFDPQP